MMLGYSFLSGICIVIATTGLLTKSLKNWQNILLIMYVSVMALISNIYTGQILGVIMIVLLLIFIFCMVDEKKNQNVFLACLGYLINLVCNNGVLFLLAAICKISTQTIIKNYWLAFSAGYALVLWLLLYFFKKLIFSKLNVQGLFEHIPRSTQRSLIATLILYLIIFLVNIALNEYTGYGTGALLFTSVLFSICLFVNIKVIITCTKGVETEERQKAALQQQKILENYVNNLEQMVDEMRAFRHDYKNILSTMAGYIREEQIEELRSFFYEKSQLPLGDKDMQMEAWRYLKSIEPMELKGFLYEKLLFIMTHNINIQVDIFDNLSIKYRHMEDLIRILGIFIDNAVEEAETLSNGQIIFAIRQTENGILFDVENNYGEKPQLPRLTQKGYSTKGEGRGIGLSWAAETLKKHTDMFHQLQITDERFIQKLEVII